MIKSTCKTVNYLATVMLVLGFLGIYIASTSNVPRLFNDQLIHQAVKPLLRSTSSTANHNRNVNVRRHRLPVRPEMVHLSNRKRNPLKASESKPDSAPAPAPTQAPKVDQKENEVIKLAEVPKRSLISINGAIDSRKYSNDELDTLYGDALLVYMKNFNDTLPARKYVRYVNETRVPMFQSRELRIQN